MSTTSLQTHPGIVRDAYENADGTFNILDVPVMTPIPKGVQHAPEDIGPEWMSRVVEFARMEAENGYLGNLHVGHHGGLGPPPEYAGKILARRVGTTVLEGQEVPALFADFLFVPEGILYRIEHHELSHRSPEVYSWQKPRLDTVALLSTEPPHNRMPCLNIRSRIPYQGDGVATFSDRSEFVAALFSATPPYAFAKEYPMPKTEQKKPTAPAKMQDEGEVEEEKPAEMEDGGGLSVDAVVKAIEDGTIMMKDFGAIKAAMDAVGSEEEGEEMPADDKTEEQTPVQLRSARNPDDAAKIRALEERLNAREEKDRVKGLVEEAVATFKSDGYDVSEKLLSDLTNFAKDGDEPFARFCDAFKRHARPESADTLAQAEGRARMRESEVVAKFSDTPEQRAQARNLSAEFAALKARGIGLSVTEEQFIRSNLNTPQAGN